MKKGDKSLLTKSRTKLLNRVSDVSKIGLGLGWVFEVFIFENNILLLTCTLQFHPIGRK